MQEPDGVIALQAKEVLESLNRVAFDLCQVTRNTDGGSRKTFGQISVWFSRADLSFGEEIWREDIRRVCAMRSLRGPTVCALATESSVHGGCFGYLRAAAEAKGTGV
jgi:hypothetical protein